MAGIDFGMDNIAAIVTTDRASRVYKGGAVLSESRSFHKRRAEAVSIITKGTKHKHADSAHLKRLSLHHDGFMRDVMHKVSTDIIRWCVEHGVGTLAVCAMRVGQVGSHVDLMGLNFLQQLHDRFDIALRHG